MELKEIELLLYVEPGAPSATVISDEYRLYLLFYYSKEVIGPTGVTNPRQRDNNEDQGVAVIKFDSILYKFGFPNVDVLRSHPYYSLGFKPYRLYELVDSDWLIDIEKRNKIHPFHNAARYKAFRHFLVAFHDSTFECLAQGLEIDFRPNLTIAQAMETVVATMN